MMERIRDYTLAVECALRSAAGGNATATVTLTPLDEPLDLNGFVPYGFGGASRWLLTVHVQRYAVVEPGTLVYVKPPDPVCCSAIINAGERVPSPQKLADMLFPREKTKG